MPAVEILFNEVVTFYQNCTAKSAESSKMLGKVVHGLKRVQQLSPPEPARVPGLKHWDQALSGIRIKNAERLRASILVAASDFRWIQNPNYNDELMGAGYMDNYGFMELVGENNAHYAAKNIRCGLFLLGPKLHYPPHNHAAEEIYHVLSGDGVIWRRGDEDWRSYPAGRPIYHAPWMVHETKTADAPLLALYCWLGGGANAKLV